MDLDRFKPDHWWNVVGGVGALIAVAAVPAQFGTAFLMGLGLLCFGVGEWINHPRHRPIIGTVVVRIKKIRGDPRNPSSVGLTFDALGIGLFMFGIFLMVLPQPTL